jgi:GWxTD domain-containing protein
VNEDVAYIIAQEERQAFERLDTEPECAMFVDQFWLRRDPTPGTPENEFKAEHYRRIAYANEHFASDHSPGWTTGRGRVYITYGPPDEIESHPKGGGPGQPADSFEQWLYHHVDALSRDILFEFVDSARDKEYGLVFVGGLTDTRQARGPVVFGPIAGLYVEVNNDRTIFVTTPVRGGPVPVDGRIIDGNGALVEKIEDVTRGSLYAKGISKSLPAGQYTLHLQVGPDDRSILFEVK